jgi:hypothetical protein
MKKIIIFLIFMFVSFNSYSECLKQNLIDKWEVISSNKILAYSNEKYYGFMNLYRSIQFLKPGSDITLRFFSPSICSFDTVVVNGEERKIDSIESIRQN